MDEDLEDFGEAEDNWLNTDNQLMNSAREGDKREDHIDTPGDLEERLARVLAARNPFLEASSVLLRALADIRNNPDITTDASKQLKALLEQELHYFTRICEQANLRRDHMLATRYALCTALDEAASQTEWAGGDKNSTGNWSVKSLLQIFHQDGKGGKTVFLLIGRMATDSQEHFNVLEVMDHILALGFKGDYGTRSDGNKLLDSIRHRLYTVVTAHNLVPRELSPHWRGESAGKLKLLRSIPVWVSASILALLIFALFGWYKYDLLTRSNQQAMNISQMKTLTLPVHKPLRLAQLLASEIAAGKVEVKESDQISHVTFRGDDMFLPGKAALNAKTEQAIKKVAEGINDVSGAVKIIGHSDNQPIKAPNIPNNQFLSEKRAQAVADLLIMNGVDKARIKSQGVGDSQPISDNTTAAGRAKNRRVDIIVSQ